ncbi:MAG: endonuclease [Methanobacteriota archaeon]
MSADLKKIYDELLTHFGHQHWWPVDVSYHEKQGSDPRFEIILGAILTQNTAWTNVEKALANLKKHHAISLTKIVTLDYNQLKTIIQPSGFFNQKAQRVQHLTKYLIDRYEGELDPFFQRDHITIRTELLSLHGIGPETADSILLYAGNHPVFVIDAYTKRISKRIPLPVKGDTYEDYQQYFDEELKKVVPSTTLVPMYQEFHALLVELAKHYCAKKTPSCSGCPLRGYCDSVL